MQMTYQVPERCAERWDEEAVDVQPEITNLYLHTKRIDADLDRSITAMFSFVFIIIYVI